MGSDISLRVDKKVIFISGPFEPFSRYYVLTGDLEKQMFWRNILVQISKVLKLQNLYYFVEDFFEPENIMSETKVEGLLLDIKNPKNISNKFQDIDKGKVFKENVNKFNFDNLKNSQLKELKIQ